MLFKRNRGAMRLGTWQLGSLIGVHWNSLYLFSYLSSLSWGHLNFMSSCTVAPMSLLKIQGKSWCWKGGWVARLISVVWIPSGAKGNIKQITKALRSPSVHLLIVLVAITPNVQKYLQTNYTSHRICAESRCLIASSMIPLLDPTGPRVSFCLKTALGKAKRACH